MGLMDPGMGFYRDVTESEAEAAMLRAMRQSSRK